MKEATWKIFLVNEQTGDIYVEFKCETNSTRKLYKWNNDKDSLLNNIKKDAINFAKNFLAAPIDNITKEELINLNSTNSNGSFNQ